MGGLYCFTALHLTSLREYTADILAREDPDKQKSQRYLYFAN